MLFREWFLLENTVSQLVKMDPDVKKVFDNFDFSLWNVLGYQNLAQPDQLALKKWLSYQIAKKDPKILGKMANMHVILDPTDRFQVRKKLNRLDYDYAALNRDNELYHKAIQSQQQRTYSEPVHVLEDLSPINGLRWVSLEKGYCDKYGSSMGHCGNVAWREGDNILSLMDSKNQHYLTFIVNHRVLGEMKGLHNQKPSPKFHPNIVELLKSHYVDVIKGLGYKPENNFQISDLSPRQQEEVMTAKPHIDNYVGYINSGKAQPRSWYIEDGHYLFDKEMSNQDFESLVDGILKRSGTETEYVSIAGEFIRRKLPVPQKLFHLIIQSPEASYYYAIQYLDSKNLPEPIIQSISNNAELAASYAGEIMKGKNVPEKLLHSIFRSPYGLPDYVFHLMDHNYDVDESVWEVIKNNEFALELLFLKKWTNGVPDKLYEFLTPDIALSIIVSEPTKFADKKNVVEMAKGANIEQMSEYMKGNRALPTSLMKIVFEKSDDPHAVYNAFKHLIEDSDVVTAFNHLDWLEHGMKVMAEEPTAAFDAVVKLQFRAKKYGVNVKIPDILFRSIADSFHLERYVLQSLGNANNKIPDYFWDRLTKDNIDYIDDALKHHNVEILPANLHKLNDLKHKFSLS